jgi:hypothetical protein
VWSPTKEVKEATTKRGLGYFLRTVKGAVSSVVPIELVATASTT